MDFRNLLSNNLSNLSDALQEDLSIVAMALESTNSGVTITDFRQLDNPIIFCNHAFENLSGYMKEEVLGRNCRFLQGDESDPGVLDQIRQSISEGKSIIVEIKNYHKNGTCFWNELSIAPIRNNEGEVTHFIGIQNDVTRKKRLEVDLTAQIEFLSDRLARQDKYLKNLQEILSNIMHTVEECILILDSDLIIQKANPNFYKLFCQSEETVVGLSFTEMHNGKYNDLALKNALLATIKGNSNFEAYTFNIESSRDGRMEVTVKAERIKIKGIKKDLILVRLNRRLEIETYIGTSMY
jgi:two-component system phosphate regulon sensor histidine kinase PhoR